ncbi:hypothetical protein PUR33_00280 [Streptomyces sp. BE282]|nr:hypothetical protein [Streptomyces sp. BE282]MEE1727583.1 hypothetical protein [Streptomyces sp. BE282]
MLRWSVSVTWVTAEGRISFAEVSIWSGSLRPGISSYASSRWSAR